MATIAEQGIAAVWTPSLNLDFMQGVMPAGLTFTRASIATRVNSLGVIETVAANVPRFDYNPVTLALKGLLIEEQRTNLALRSSELDNTTPWGTRQGLTGITANATIAPDGTMSADKIVESNTNTTHKLGQNTAISAGSTYTFSVFAKAAERTAIQVQIFDGTANAFPSFDLSTGALINAGNADATKIENYGNGWWRFSVTKTMVATSTSLAIYPCILSANGYQGDGTSGIYAWGAQLEQGSFPTSIIPTTTAAVTRGSETFITNGTTFGALYNPNEGAFFVDFVRLVIPPAGNPSTFAALGIVGASNSYISLESGFSSPAQQRMQIQNLGAQQVLLTPYGTALANTNYRLIGTWRTNDFAVFQNLGTIQTSTSGIIPSGINQVSVTSSANSLIRKIRYYPRRLPNSYLQYLTN